MKKCCLDGFHWNGTPEGTESKLSKNATYVTGSNKDVAILVVHDVWGWKWQNMRLLADHYAAEVGATAFVPDFFDGEEVPLDSFDTAEKMAAFDHDGFTARHSKAIRGPELVACVKALREEHGFKKVGAVGFCFGGWAVLSLGAKGQNLVDCVSAVHPTEVWKSELDNIGVPVQLCVPEIDPLFSPDLKAHALEVIPKLGVEFDYQYFPGLVHGFASRGNPKNPAQRRGMERAKNAMVLWLTQYLHPRD